MLAKAITVRKVRASQGRITDNVRRRRLPGKCNRNKPPEAFLTSIEVGFFTPLTVVVYGEEKKAISVTICTVKSVSGKDGKAR